MSAPVTPLTAKQEEKLRILCERYGVAYDPEHYVQQFDLPTGWVGGWIGGNEHSGYPGSEQKRTIYVGVSPEGEAHS